jgi:hypothetical protein
MSLLQSSKLKLDHDVTKPFRTERGPNSNQGPGGLSDLEFVAQFAYPDELKNFRAEIEKRKAAEPKSRFYRCDSCGFKIQTRWKKESDEGGFCLSCNSMNHKSGGHLVEMSEKEVKIWEADKATKAQAESERERKAGLFAANQDRQKAGLPVWTMQEYLEIMRRT